MPRDRTQPTLNRNSRVVVCEQWRSRQGVGFVLCILLSTSPTRHPSCNRHSLVLCLRAASCARGQSWVMWTQMEHSLQQQMKEKSSTFTLRRRCSIFAGAADKCRRLSRTHAPLYSEAFPGECQRGAACTGSQAVLDNFARAQSIIDSITTESHSSTRYQCRCHYIWRR